MQAPDRTFVGFWPASTQFGEPECFALDECSLPDRDTQRALRATLLSYDGPGWKIKLCADYLLLLHLETLEEALQEERNQGPDLVNFSLGATRKARTAYLEALNALNFLLFAAARTGHNHVFLHDFREVSIWDCARIMYDATGNPLRHATYGRFPDTAIRREGKRQFSQIPQFNSVEHSIFSDAAFYWGWFYELGLLPMAAVGAKIVSEHRLQNYGTAIALAWFEIESWIYQTAAILGLRTKSKRGRYLFVSQVIDQFPAGTTVANRKGDLDTLREKRNQVAHANAQASREDSALAIGTFLYVLTTRTGLSLEVDLHEIPTLGF